MENPENDKDTIIESSDDKRKRSKKHKKEKKSIYLIIQKNIKKYQEVEAEVGKVKRRNMLQQILVPRVMKEERKVRDMKDVKKLK